MEDTFCFYLSMKAFLCWSKWYFQDSTGKLKKRRTQVQNWAKLNKSKNRNPKALQTHKTKNTNSRGENTGGHISQHGNRWMSRQGTGETQRLYWHMVNQCRCKTRHRWNTLGDTQGRTHNRTIKKKQRINNKTRKHKTDTRNTQQKVQQNKDLVSTGHAS